MNADARVAQHRHPHHLPTRGAQRQHGFALALRNGHQNLAGDRRDDGNDHDGQDDSGGQHANAIGGAGKKIGPAEVLTQPRLHIIAQERSEYENSPESVDDRRNGRQQLHGERNDTAQISRAQFGDEDCNSDGKWNGEHKCDERRHQRSVDERHRAEDARDRVPGAAKKESETETCDGELRA